MSYPHDQSLFRTMTSGCSACAVNPLIGGNDQSDINLQDEFNMTELLGGADQKVDFCTLLDEIHKIAPELVKLAHSVCYSSVWSRAHQNRPITVIIPQGKAMKELLKSKRQNHYLRLHTIMRAIIPTPSEDLEDYYRTGLFNQPTVERGPKKTLIIDGVTVTHKFTHKGSEIYVTDELLPLPSPTEVKNLEDAAAIIREKRFKDRGQRFKETPVKGGLLINPEYGTILQVPDIVLQYQQVFPEKIFKMNTKFHYSTWMYSSFVTYLYNKVPDYFEAYKPFFGWDPLETIYSIFSPFETTSGMGGAGLVNQEVLRNWLDSEYFLSTDPNIIKEARTILKGVSVSYDGASFAGIPGIQSYAGNKLIKQNIDTARDMLGKFSGGNPQDSGPLYHDIHDAYSQVMKGGDLTTSIHKLLGETDGNPIDYKIRSDICASLIADVRRFGDPALLDKVMKNCGFGVSDPSEPIQQMFGIKYKVGAPEYFQGGLSIKQKADFIRSYYFCRSLTFGDGSGKSFIPVLTNTFEYESEFKRFLTDTTHLFTDMCVSSRLHKHIVGLGPQVLGGGQLEHDWI